jgi:iron complex outermembrane recepter protein
MNVLTRKKSLLLAILATAVLAAPPAIQAEKLDVQAEEQEGQTEKPVILGDITVKGEAITTDPTTVNTVTSEDIEGLKLLRPEQLLEQVPGIQIRDLGQGGVANSFEMRGFSSCGHGGDAAIAIDGIPLNEGQSHADGYADMNVIIPLEIDHVDVFMGPSSPLFGNFARGGSISFNTKKTGEYSTLQTSIGSNNTYDTQYAFGRSFSDTFRNNTALQFTTTDGYQDNSSWQRENFSTRFAWKTTQDLDLALSFRIHKSIWDAPGYIPEYQFNNVKESYHQAVNAEDDGGDKLFTTQRLDAGYRLTGSSKLLIWTYTTEQDFTRWQKSGYNVGGQLEYNYDRFVYGAGTSYNYEGKMAGKELNGVAGIEYYHEDTDTNVYNTTNRVRSTQSQDRNFVIDTASLFGQVDYALYSLFKPWIGLRYDSFSGGYTNDDPGKEPFSQDMNDYSHLSPKIGFHSELHKSLDFRTSFTQGFVLPSNAVKYNSDVGDTATTINQYEAGLKFAPSKLIAADLAVFQMDTSNEIQEYPSGSGKFLDLGETRRRGLELSTVLIPWIAGLEVFGNLTFTNSEIMENADMKLIGKHVTGVPDYVSDLGVRYKFESGITPQIKWRHVDRFYLDTTNLYTYDGYDVTNLAISYSAKTKSGTKYRIGFDIDNLFDEHYATSVSYSSGVKNYEVAPPRTYWLRLTLDFSSTVGGHFSLHFRRNPLVSQC